jgi:hypothetical protein
VVAVSFIIHQPGVTFIIILKFTIVNVGNLNDEQI